MELFRGDHIYNSTEPGRYRFDGIRSKAFGQGTPHYIEPSNLIENIRKHVNPLTASDFAFYNATDFLSFSTSKSRALHFLTYGGTLPVLPVKDDYSETRYLFTLQIDNAYLVALDHHATIFRYDFACSPSLKRPNTDDIRLHALVLGTDYGTYFKSCPVCNGTESRHAIYLIDTVKYLIYYRNSAKYNGAINLAMEDQEWLIVPTDQLTGEALTTIPRADFWNAELYSSPKESRPNSIHEILGIEH